MGASYLEGAKYSDEVRVVKMNDKVIDLCGGTHVSNTSEVKSIVVYNFEKRGSGVFRIEAATAEFAERRLFEANEKYIREASEQITSRMNSLVDRNGFFENEFDLSKAENVFAKIKELDLNQQKVELKNKYLEIEKEFNFEFSRVSEELNKKFLSVVKQTLEQDSKFVKLDLTGFTIKDVNKLTSSMINEYDNKVLVVRVSDDKKGTVAVTFTKEFVDTPLVDTIKSSAEGSNLRGNGNRQLYVFGGSADDSMKMFEEVDQ